ncbi:hypothetical protein BS50DRAFT_623219 [Corynespora cassiicola Philippines]|uniref:Protein kinase domain-containing protein n=1 Tax=Corynespora cassiicola Philippines TaxID=1448308 RepID=A0A2T2NH56_CORCC|nr:hypothetical protein BS50DRAFT_623219 [Corynespora cassiicola Philippines]
MEELRRLLRKQWKKSVFGTRPIKFIPENSIYKHVTRQTIYTCLGHSAEKGLVDFIFDRAPKAFLITVLHSLPSLEIMSWFKQNDLDDKTLPIKHTPDSWEEDWGDEFFEEQWKFFATVFSTKEPFHDLEEAHILPFISMPSDPAQGFFGVVHQYVVHKDHIEPAPEHDISVAVKEIQAKEDAQEEAGHWQKEVKALRMMNQLKQEHIVHFITSFRRKRNHERYERYEHYLMFEWADGGNLRSLWNADPFPVLSTTLVKETVKQLLGLSMALDAAHNLNKTNASYRHGDLKPENILRFKTEGTIGILKIADWGEAKFHHEVTFMRPSKTTARYGTRRYEAPEIETGMKLKFLGQSPKRVSRLYDIWAMGCIILEFLIWLLYGVNELNRFLRELNEESFYQVTDDGPRKVAKIHKTVALWIEYMEQDPRCQPYDTAIGDLLELVKTGLLVVKLPQRGGTDLSDEELERPRVDSVSMGSNPKHGHDVTSFSNSNQLKSSEDPAAGGIPSLIVTSAENSTRIPVAPEPEPRGPSRCRAADFRERMQIIYDEERHESYWHTRHTPDHPPLDTPSAYLESSKSPQETGPRGEAELPAREKRTGPSKTLGVPGTAKINYAHPDLDENDWKYRKDNKYASTLFSSLKNDSSSIMPRVALSLHLCNACNDFRNQLLIPGFSVTYTILDLQARSEVNDCNLCRLLWRTFERHRTTRTPTVRFERLGSFLMLNNHDSPVLSIVCSPQENISPLDDYQSTHLGVIRHWLEDCDQNHICAPKNGRNSFRSGKIRLPTRLVDVGTADNETVRLWETSAQDTGEWTALSHKWGDHHFSTTIENLNSHKEGMKLCDLPTTFRDAIIVTRAMGRQYLWIDSLCVIQGPDGDFKTEAKRMEDVYSGAYCVIAASNSIDHYSGFLKDRIARDYVGMCREGRDESPFYICQNIDNFKGHVLDGELHRRGWVLQEHALARRTVFFTDYQTYFECGEGIRCETSTKLNNDVARFRGDPDFPHILSSAGQGEKILRYQELYKEYSRLGLSNEYDRPVAIDGLQQRLLRTMHVNGGFGVFDEGKTRGLLRRSLLWCRGADTPTLSRIRFPTDRSISNVPSWSWMAYIGGIDYLELEFGTVEWEDLQSPWSGATANADDTNANTAKITLKAEARHYDPGAALVEDGKLILDIPSESSPSTSLCVVLGKEKGNRPRELKMRYVLIIKEQRESVEGGDKVYARVGVGCLPGTCISESGIKVCIH